MVIALIQIAAVPGVVSANVAHHLAWASAAAQHGAQLIFFPELSLTGYEPTRAEELAMEPTDPALRPLQALADQHGVSIGVGLPWRCGPDCHIALVMLRPTRPPWVYAKHFLHPDEWPFFQAGPHYPGLLPLEPPVGIAICYEISVLAHATKVAQAGAGAYVASVAKFGSGIAAAHARMAEIAQAFALPTMLVNAVGPADAGSLCAGQSGVWDGQGQQQMILGAEEERGLWWDLSLQQGGYIDLE